jgi:hypothetical protein
VEHRAAEPVLPLGLFGNRVFVVTSAVGFVVGFALFGALTYLPLYQQVVRGQTPTSSGLQLLPVMGGLLLSATLSGQAITRTGRYKVYPVVGTAVAAIGLLSLSGLDGATSTLDAAWRMLVLGLGLGLVMQVLILAVQNAVAYENLGVATSGATLFRSMGGALGTAILGAIFAGRLTHELAARLPPAVGGRADTAGALDPAALERLPAPIHEGFVGAFTSALSTIFLVAAVVAAVAFLLSWLIEERPLRQTVETSGLDDVFASPRDSDSMRELLRELSRAAGRERTREFLEEAAAAACIDLSPPEIFVLGRVAHEEPIDRVLFGDRPPEEAASVARGSLERLRARGLVEGEPAALTPEGEAVHQRVLEARRHALETLVGEWQPDANPEIDPLVRQVADSLDQLQPR